MAFENVYQALMQVWEISKANSANIFGVEIGIVTNVKDPDKAGRVKVCFPRLPGKPESDWARVGQPAAGPGRGFYWLPQVNDEVLIAFERGQANAPYVIGSLWNGKDKPMKDAYTDENTKIMIQTKSGHQLLIDDTKDQEKITLGDKSGKRTITWDVKNKKFLIEAKEGDFEIHAEKKIVLQCEDLEIKTTKTGKIDIGTTFDLKIAQKGGFKAGPQMNMKSGKVSLNPPELTIEALVTAAEQAVAAAAAAAAEQAAEKAAEQSSPPPADAAPVPTQAPADQPPGEPQITNPSWGDQNSFQHGDTAQLTADTQHLAGKTVFFIIEHEVQPGQWEQLDVVSATAGQDKATVNYDLEHPQERGHRDAAAPHPSTVSGSRNIRFHASLTHPGEPEPQPHYVHHRFLDQHTGKGVANMPFRVFDAAGTQVATGTTDGDGWASAQVPDAGDHRIEFDPPGKES